MPEYYQNSAILRVCVESSSGGHLAGLVYSARFAAPIAFTDMGMLILRLDELLEQQNAPQAFQRARSFQKSKAGAAPDEAEPCLPPETVATAVGAVGTFVLTVLSRRNASWQGEIDWLDGTPPVPFASALALLKLMKDHPF